MADATLNQLFKMAVTAELTAETFYKRLAQMFVNYPEVVAFWEKYAEEEAAHARWLTDMHTQLSPLQQTEPADPGMLEMANHTLQVSLEDLLESITNLEDAYQLANELENAETNAICEFLIDHFANNEKTQAFLRAQLRNHISRLATDFPTHFKGVLTRQSIAARHPDQS